MCPQNTARTHNFKFFYSPFSGNKQQQIIGILIRRVLNFWILIHPVDITCSEVNEVQVKERYQDTVIDQQQIETLISFEFLLSLLWPCLLAWLKFRLRSRLLHQQRRYRFLWQWLWRGCQMENQNIQPSKKSTNITSINLKERIHKIKDISQIIKDISQIKSLSRKSN